MVNGNARNGLLVMTTTFACTHMHTHAKDLEKLRGGGENQQGRKDGGLIICGKCKRQDLSVLKKREEGG